MGGEFGHRIHKENNITLYMGCEIRVVCCTGIRDSIPKMSWLDPSHALVKNLQYHSRWAPDVEIESRTSLHVLELVWAKVSHSSGLDPVFS